MIASAGGDGAPEFKFASKLVVREPTHEDYDGIAVLYSQVWNEPRDFHTPNVQWAYGYAQAHGGSLIATIGDSVVAARCALSWPIESGHAERIDAVQQHGTAVALPHRRRGIFSDMAGRLNQTLAERGFAFAFNISVPASRVAHEKLGWQYQAGLRRYFTVDACVYQPRTRDVEITEVSGENLSEVVSWLRQSRTSSRSAGYQTHWSTSFLTWRLSRPGARYLLARNTAGQGVLGRKGELRGLKVLLVGARLGPSEHRRSHQPLLRALMKHSATRIATTIDSDAYLQNHPRGGGVVRDPRRASLNLGVKPLTEDAVPIASRLHAGSTWFLSQIDHDNF